MARTRRNRSSPLPKTASWPEFAAKASLRKGWEAQDGVATYRANDAVCRIRIVLPTNVLLPGEKRAELTAKALPVEFEVLCASPKEPGIPGREESRYNRHKALAAFDFEWSKLWRAGCCPRTAHVPPCAVEKPPPPRLRRLASLASSLGEPPDLEAYHATRISRTPAGVLWGQDALAVAEPMEEPGTPLAMAPCAFCGGKSMRVFVLGEGEREYLRIEESVSLAGCAGCGRVAEIVGGDE